MSSGSYRYGFGGKENDNEAKGTGNQQDYGMRIYDPRLGRFLSLDPLWKTNSFESNYAYAHNSPILMQDIEGKNGEVTIVKNENGKGGTITITTTVYVHAQVSSNPLVEKAFSESEAKARNNYLAKNKDALSGQYVDKDGGTWNISLKINYVAFEPGKLSIGAGDNELFLNDPGTNGGRTPNDGSSILGQVQVSPPSISNPAGISRNLLREFTGNKSYIGIGKRSVDHNTKTHELLHQFGLGERYGRASDSNVPFNDVMYGGSDPLSIDQVHWNNWGRSILDMSQNFEQYKIDSRFKVHGNTSTNFILNWFVDSNGGSVPFGQYNVNEDGSRTLKDPLQNLGYEK